MKTEQKTFLLCEKCSKFVCFSGFSFDLRKTTFNNTFFVVFGILTFLSSGSFNILFTVVQLEGAGKSCFGWENQNRLKFCILSIHEIRKFASKTRPSLSQHQRFLPRKSFSPSAADGFSFSFSQNIISRAHSARLDGLSNLDNLTLKRRDDLLVLVLARYVSSDGVVSRERSRAEGTRHADSLMALANVGS